MANIVNQYWQVKVGVRVASGGGGNDADAQAFITAASITDSTQQNAINTLVTDLKGYGIWSKMKAVYPFVGGSASSHKFNLKDPRDLDAAFRLVFNGGWTHSSTGALPNGTTGWARTYLTPSSNLSNANFHVSYYSRTDVDGNHVELGCGDSFGYYSPHLRLRFGGNQARFVCGNTTNYGLPPVTNTDSRGHFIGNILSTSNRKFYKNSNIIQTNTSVITNSLYTGEMVLAGYNFSPTSLSVILNSAKESAFASIGDGLTDTEAANFYTAVQAYQTTLGRNV